MGDVGTGLRVFTLKNGLLKGVFFFIIIGIFCAEGRANNDGAEVQYLTAQAAASETEDERDNRILEEALNEVLGEFAFNNPSEESAELRQAELGTHSSVIDSTEVRRAAAMEAAIHMKSASPPAKSINAAVFDIIYSFLDRKSQVTLSASCRDAFHQAHNQDLHVIDFSTMPQELKPRTILGILRRHLKKSELGMVLPNNEIFTINLSGKKITTEVLTFISSHFPGLTKLDLSDVKMVQPDVQMVQGLVKTVAFRKLKTYAEEERNLQRFHHKTRRLMAAFFTEFRARQWASFQLSDSNLGLLKPLAQLQSLSTTGSKTTLTGLIQALGTLAELDDVTLGVSPTLGQLETETKAGSKLASRLLERRQKRAVNS